MAKTFTNTNYSQIMQGIVYFRLKIYISLDYAKFYKELSILYSIVSTTPYKAQWPSAILLVE